MDSSPQPHDPEQREAPVLLGFSLFVMIAVWLFAMLVYLRWVWVRGGANDTGLFIQISMAALPGFWVARRYWTSQWMVRRGNWKLVPIELDRRKRIFLLISAWALRLVLIDLPPQQSDDLYRYVWEGRVQRAGMSPYHHAPDSAELESLRDENWEKINHPEYSAIYPPLAQWLFLLCAAIFPHIVTFKLAFAICDILVLAVLMRWLERLGRSPAWAALWAFHPLVIVEFSGNGHVDSLMILMIVLALWCLEEGWEGRATLALAGAVAAKLIPLLLLPYFFWRMRRWWLLGFVPLLVALSYAPYAAAGSEGLWQSLWVYQRDWLYNAPIFDFARDTLFGTDGFLARWWFYGALGLLGAVLWFLKAEPAAALLPVLGFYQLAGPVVHPWYLAVFIPLVCVRRGGWPWIWLTVAVPLVYIGEQDPGVRLAVWGPFFVMLAAQGGAALKNRIERGRNRPGTPPIQRAP